MSFLTAALAACLDANVGEAIQSVQAGEQSTAQAAVGPVAATVQGSVQVSAKVDEPGGKHGGKHGHGHHHGCRSSVDVAAAAQANVCAGDVDVHAQAAVQAQIDGQPDAQLGVDGDIIATL